MSGSDPITLDQFVPRAKEFSENWGLLTAPLDERTPDVVGSVQDLWITARLASIVLGVVEVGVSAVKEDQFLDAQQMVNDVMMREAFVSLGGQIVGRSRSFQWTYRFQTLRAVAFWHLGNLTIGEDRVGRCLYCGKRFERTHGSQNFCPPLHHDGFGRRQSPCGLKHRQRKIRASKKSES